MSEPEHFKRIVEKKGPSGKIEFSMHATEETYEDNIQYADVCHALSHESCDVLERDPDDPRGPSALFVGPDADVRMIHVVVGGFEREYPVIITEYRPEKPRWKVPYTEVI